MKTAIGVLIIVLSVASAQGRQSNGEPQRVGRPWVIAAEVPFYPTTALAAHFGGTVVIEVTVEAGKVAKSEVKSVAVRSQDGRPIVDNPKLKPYLSVPSLANVKTWRFAPEERGTFIVTYTYRIDGTETPTPESPTVILDLPTSVTVTARPYRPTTT